MSEALDEVDPVAVEEDNHSSVVSVRGFPARAERRARWRRMRLRTAGPAERRRSVGRTWRSGARGGRDLRDRLRRLLREAPAQHPRAHPALDEWMIVDGYGKVLAPPGVDLKRASCAWSPPAPSRPATPAALPPSRRPQRRRQPAEVAAVLDALDRSHFEG